MRAFKGLTLVTSCRSTVRSLHSRQGLGDPPEQVLNVMSDLRARLDEHQIVLLRLLFALLRRHLALIVQIGLVSHQDNDDIVPSLAPDVVYPFTCVLERLCIWYVRLVSTLHIRPDQRGYAYWRYRRPPPQHLNRVCTKESDCGNALAQPCPIVVNGLFGPQGT